MKNNRIKNFQKRMPATTGSQYTDIDDLIQSNTESHLHVDMEAVSIDTIIRKALIFFNKIGHTYKTYIKSQYSAFFHHSGII